MSKHIKNFEDFENDSSPERNTKHLANNNYRHRLSKTAAPTRQRRTVSRNGNFNSENGHFQKFSHRLNDKNNDTLRSKIQVDKLAEYEQLIDIQNVLLNNSRNCKLFDNVNLTSLRHCIFINKMENSI